MTNIIHFDRNHSLKIKKEEIKTVEWRRKKIINPQTGKEIFEDSKIGKMIKKEENYKKKISCSPGYRYDGRKDKCVKIKENLTSPKKKTILKKTDCPVGYIVNPLTRKCVKVDSEAGKRAIRINYEKNFW